MPPSDVVGLLVKPPQPQRAPSGGGRPGAELRGLTGLRIVAAAWVVAFHFHFTPLPGVAAAVDLLGPLVTTGALGVDLFFTLSGFVIAHTYLDRLGPRLRVRAAGGFLWARVCRLWPAYALVLHVFALWLLARLCLGADRDIAFQAVQPVLSGPEYLQQLVMVQVWDQSFFDGASWVGPTWSISAEWLAYLLFPLAAVGFFRLRGLPAPVLAVAAVGVMTPMAWSYLVLGHPYFPYSWLVRILCGFGAGVLVYLAVRRVAAPGLRCASLRVRRGAAVLAAGLPVVMAAGLLLGERFGPGCGGVVIVLFPLLVGALAVADRGPAMLLSRRWAVHGGRISYALYLVHIPLLEFYWLALRRFAWLGAGGIGAYVVGLAVVAATVPVAELVFRLVEEPSRRRMRRWAAARPAPPRVAGGPVPTPPSVPPARAGSPAEARPVPRPFPTVPGPRRDVPRAAPRPARST